MGRFPVLNVVKTRSRGTGHGLVMSTIISTKVMGLYNRGSLFYGRMLLFISRYPLFFILVFFVCLICLSVCR